MRFPAFRTQGMLLLALASAQAQQVGTVLQSPFSISRAGGNAAGGGFIVAPGEILQVLVTAGFTLPTLLPNVSIPYTTKLGELSAKVMQGNGNSLDVPIVQLGSYSDCGGILTVLPLPCQRMLAVTVQIPYGIMTDSPFGEYHQSSALVFFNNDSAVASAAVTPLTDSIRVLTSCGLSTTQPVNPFCAPVVTHADGTPGYPRPFMAGETVVIYATGLGKVNPVVADGAAPTAAASTTEPIWVDFNYRANAQAVSPVLQLGITAADGYSTPWYAGVTPGYPGLYQVNVQLPPVPAGTPACGGKVASNLTITIIGVSSFDAAPICVATQ